MAYKEGSMSTEQLKKIFGDSLQVRDDGHTTFSNDGDVDKFMGDSKLRSTFTGAMGRSASDWDDGSKSANDLGTLVRFLSKDEGTPAADPTANPNIQLSERAAGAIGGTKAFEDAQASGLLSDMRFGGSDGSSQADAFTKYRDTYKSNVKKALSNNAGIKAGDTNDTGTAGGGEYTFKAKDKSDVAKKLIGKGAGLQDLAL